MYSVVAQRLLQILTLKAGPQDLPTSPGLLQFSAGAFIVFAILRMTSVASFAEAAVQAILSLVVLFLYIRALLRWKQTPERLTQTLTALLLCGAFLGALLLFPLHALKPVLLAVAQDPNITPSQLEVPAMAAYAWAGLSLWGVIVSGHILRHALGVSLGIGVAATLIYEFLLIGIVGLFSSLF